MADRKLSRHTVARRNGQRMTDPFKLVILPATKAEMSRTALHHYLEHNHGPLVMKYPDVGGRFTGYEHHYVQSAPAVVAGCDAVTIINFADISDLIASKASENYRLHVGPDEDNFRDEAASRAFRAEPRVIRDGPRDAPCKLLIFRRLRGGAETPAQWENHMAAMLEGGKPGLLRLVVNRLSPLDGSGDYDILDEISLAGPDRAAHATALVQPPSEGLLSGLSVALVTRPMIFV